MSLSSGSSPTATLDNRGSPWRRAVRRLAGNRLALVGAILIAIVAMVAIFAPLIAPKGFAEASLPDNYASPGSEFIMGADFLGRDIFSRIIYGARVSLAVGLAGATTAALIGVAYGAVSGYYGGRVDAWMTRLLDLLYGIPAILVVILLMVYFRAASASSSPSAFVRGVSSVDDALGGVFFIVVGIALTSWLTTARLVRGMVLSLKTSQFVEAAQVLGASDMRLIRHHLIPQVIGAVVVAETLSIPGYILAEAFLSFIGLGVPPPTPSWGGMVEEGFRSLRSHPHVVLFPAGILSITLLAFNFLGDGLRDAFDPRSG